MNGDQKLNFGDWLHIVQIAVLIGSLGVFYQKIDSALHMVGAHAQQLQRIEHYLSSKDTNYWKLSREDQ